MRAFHNDYRIKENVLAQLQVHYDADEIVKGSYWENGKGCAVGCTIHGSEHKEYEDQLGIPESLAHLEDFLFEAMPNESAKEWPIHFIEAVPVGADLSLVEHKFKYWLLTDESVNPGIDHSSVRKEVAAVAELVERRVSGEVIPPEELEAAERAAAYAAWGATSGGATSAAWWAVRSAAALATVSTAWCAARSAAENAARSAFAERMAHKLIEILKEAK